MMYNILTGFFDIRVLVEMVECFRDKIPSLNIIRAVCLLLIWINVLY